MVDPKDPTLSIVKQCILLFISRSGVYYQPASESELDLQIMLEIDKYFTLYPFYGTRRMSDHLKEKGYHVGRKAIRSYYIKMGIGAIYPKKKPNTSEPNKEHKVYSYLLRNLKIERKNHVWATDITFIPMPKGHMYLCAIIDLYSRYVLSWNISNTMDTALCIGVLKDALQHHGKPKIFNSDQGSQFTYLNFTNILEDQGVMISMDSVGRALDNIFIERLWRSVKYECIYLNAFENGVQLYQGLEQYFKFYNCERKHQSLDYQTPEKLFKKIV